MTRSPVFIFIPVVVFIVAGVASLSAFALSALLRAPSADDPGLPSLARVEALVDGKWAATVRVFETHNSFVTERLLLLTEDKAAAVAAAVSAEPTYNKPLHGDPRVAFWVLWPLVTVMVSAVLSVVACVTLRKLMSASAAKDGHSLIAGHESSKI
jgi:hypothetical protein